MRTFYTEPNLGLPLVITLADNEEEAREEIADLLEAYGYTPRGTPDFDVVELDLGAVFPDPEDYV